MVSPDSRSLPPLQDIPSFQQRGGVVDRDHLADETLVSEVKKKWREGGKRVHTEEERGRPSGECVKGAGPGRPLSKKAGGASGWASLLGAKVGVGVGEFIVCPNEGDEWLGETIVWRNLGNVWE